MSALLFRKKPVVIEAVQFTGDNFEEIAAFVPKQSFPAYNVTQKVCFINTLEAQELRADAGDWIIKGVKGEFYPCKPDIFAQTYDLVGPTTRPTIEELEKILANAEPVPININPDGSIYA
jgi:hypothetical protein